MIIHANEYHISLLIICLCFSFLILSCDTPDRFKKPVKDESKKHTFYEPPHRTNSELHYTGFTVQYNPSTKQPKWVSYTLTAKQVETTKHTPKFSRHYMPDPNLDLPQATNEDYRNSGWVKGHMARRQDMKWSEQAVIESDYFTNICPQNEIMNNGVWHKIENLVRRIATQYGSVHVICGPIFTDTLNGHIGPNHIPVPDCFFKTLLIKDGSAYHSIAFLCPNKESVLSMLEATCTVNMVESMSQIDVYSYLPDDVEEYVESQIDTSLWNIW